MIRLILVRHGETEWTRQGRFQGKTDVPLNRAGKAQAKQAQKKLKNWKFDLCYCSSLGRARETASIILKGRRKPLRIEDRLREFSFGTWEGKRPADLFKKKDRNYLNWLRGKKGGPPGGESVGALKKRVRSFLRSVARSGKNKDILVISHGGTIRIILLLALELEDRRMWSFRLDPASVSVLEMDSRWSQISLWNDTSHLKDLK